MKKTILFCVLGAILTSCMPSLTPFVQDVYILNYNEIAGFDFLITESNSVSFDYIGIGSIVVHEETGGGTIITKEIKDSNDDIYGNMKTQEIKGVRKANVYSALERAVEEAKSAGGDGIINLKTQAFNGEVTITGMIIKRK